MKVETQPSSACRMKLTIRAEAAETRADYEEIVGLYVKQGRLPGFRAGHAPRQVVEHRYHREIDGDVRNRLIGKFYHQALAESKMAAVAVVDVTDVIFSPETGLSFVALVDVAPEFKLPKYKKIPLKVETPVVTEEQISAQVDRLRNMLAKYEDAPGAAAARGDLACIDYTATCDGKPLLELFPDAAALAGGVDFWAQVDEPEFIPGVALALEGAKAGDERTVTVKFEKDFHLEAVRGRKAVYQLKVKNVRRRVLPADEDVCKRVGLENLAALRESTRKNLLATAETRELNRQRQEVVDFLLKRTEFDLPQSAVADETNQTVRSMLHDMVNRGGTREDLEKNRDAILEAATTASKDRVRLRYILARIAEEENIQAADAEVEQRLRDLAAQHRMPVEKLRADIEERHGLEALRSDLRAEKALARLIEEAKAK